MVCRLCLICSRVLKHIRDNVIYYCNQYECIVFRLARKDLQFSCLGIVN